MRSASLRGTGQKRVSTRKSKEELSVAGVTPDGRVEVEMGKIAFVFPGQASQYAGMGKELAEKYPAARAVF